MWLVKTDANGVAQWNQTYDRRTANDKAYSVLQAADGGFVLAGHTSWSWAGGSDMWLVKTDANGVAQWNQAYGGPGDDGADSVLQTADGGFVLAGHTSSYGAGGSDMWLVKTDANGVAQWNQTYGGPGGDRDSSILQTAEGGYILAGNTDSYGTGEGDMWLVKTDAQGVAQWNQTYGGISWDYAYSVLQTADGGFVLAGSTNSYGAGLADMWLVKTDAQGVPQWNQAYGGTEGDRADSVLQTADGGFVLAGSTISYWAGAWSYNMWLVKTDANGVAQWNQTCGGPGDDWAYSVLQTADGGFVLAGSTSPLWPGGSKMWLVKISAKKDSKGAPGLDALPLLAAILALNLWHKRKKRLTSSNTDVQSGN
jgi:hypothetical protein